ncbi:MAG TPA: isoprenylcysteine carboxylmethyltransferase family protein [Candidatus Acidoferrales bacterium]|nr:isoprenylcysteine carboxylmethyltransferase family protein [Candidatus Acidoferrales bacterium]
MIRACEYLWVALGLYWLVTARGVKRTKASESRATDILRRGFWVVGYVLLFTEWGRISWLGRRFVPHAPAVADAGLGLTILGLGLAAWARHCLGGNWSAAVALKEGHELVRAGPYARIRHPIYTGLELAIAGTALAVGEWRGVAVFALAAGMYAVKARKEETILAQEFGAAFAEHRRHTGSFLPRLS